MSAAPPAPLVGIVVVHWQSRDDTRACLTSLRRLTHTPTRVYVVDNGGDSAAWLAHEFPEAAVLAPGANLGYTGGNNLGLRRALADGCDLVWLLNDDVTVAPDSLARLLAALAARPAAGFAGPLVLTREQPDVILSAGGFFRDRWRPWQRAVGQRLSGEFDGVEVVDFLSGCALLVNRPVIAAIGELDDDFFAYYEDVDWCYRGRQAGFSALFVPEAHVWHPDTRQRDQMGAAVQYYLTRNDLLFLRKHRLGRVALLSRLGQYGRTWLSWRLRPRWRGRARQRTALGRGLRDFFLDRRGPAGWL